MVIDEESMLQEKSKMEDKTKGETSDNSADSQKKEFEFSDDPNNPVGSDKDPKN